MKPLAGNLHFQSALFDFQLLRSLHHSHYGGPDFGECLAIAMRIRDGNRDDWYREWTAVGETTRAQAETFLAQGNTASARRMYFRAFECHRSAAYFLLGNPENPILHSVVDRMQSCFRKAGELMDGRMHVLTIPYEKTALPGYFIQAEGVTGPRPTVIINTGYTSFCEEAYFFGGVAALERGWNILLYDGPGQGSALVKQGLPFRPDWENVFTPLVDHALTLPGVDPKAIVVFGRSFNGLLSLRAVAKDSRVVAFMTDPGEYNKYRDAVHDFPPEALAAFDRDDDQLLARYLEEQMQKPDVGFSYECRIKAHGAVNAIEYIRELKKYDFTDALGSIRCPTAISCADHDDRGTEQAQEMYDALKGEKTYFPFRAEQGAGEHCQVGAPGLCYQTFYDWLEDVLRRSILA